MFREYIPTPQHIKNKYIGRNNGKVGTLIDKFPIEQVKIDVNSPAYQNEIDYNQVAEMLLNFNEKLWEPILVDIEYHLVDGQHRMELAKLLRLKYIDVIIENDKNKTKIANNPEENKRVSNGIEFAENLELEQTTVWDFPERGTWATHSSNYRGNFAPQVARNVILNYSKEGELVLDPMVGSGTTLIEARVLNRNAIGYDINQNAVKITQERINFPVNNSSRQIVSLGDVRNLSNLKHNFVDLILTHPPYANIITYSNGENPKDLSSISDIDDFLDQLEIGIQELFRVLKPDRYCAILIGDTRKSQHYIPLSHFVLQRCLKVGFVLKEQIIKLQHNCRYARRWIESADRYKFYLIMHEHLFIFRKPNLSENLSGVRYSMLH